MAKEKKEFESAKEVIDTKYRFDVVAVKVKEIKNIGSASSPDSAGDGSKIINGSFTVPFSFVQEFAPEVGDYVLINEDGELGCLSESYFEANFKKLK